MYVISVRAMANVQLHAINHHVIAVNALDAVVQYVKDVKTIAVTTQIANVRMARTVKIADHAHVVNANADQTV